MARVMNPERQLNLVSRAWGHRKGYVFFPTIKGEAKGRVERAKGFREGPAFAWPEDRDIIIAHIEAHFGDEQYFCPVLFEGKHRVEHLARDEKCLWADLDERDPSTIKPKYRPTIAWETSPGRYQALWILRGVLQGASWIGKENQRLTSYLKADPSGWDTTQLLRLPGSVNHKYPNSPLGKVLWSDGRVYSPEYFDGLPEIDVPSPELFLDDDVAAVDRLAVFNKVRLKLSSEVRGLIKARTAQGDRSSKLWQIERELADAGCTGAEIMAIAKETVWNKFLGRDDEMRRLKSEAVKAIAARPKEVQQEVEQERDVRPDPVALFDLIKDYKPPQWLIKDIWAAGSCGFIAGQPKSYKTWIAMDMAFAVATGTPFLGHFKINDVGPVLYVQEEDSIGTVKVRSEKIWRERIRMILTIEDGKVKARGVGPESDIDAENIPLDAYIGHGFLISDEDWQAWLAEQIERKGYKLVVLDPLMMIAGDVEEFKAQAMTEQVFKPLKQIARKYGTAICVVHHMRKGEIVDGHPVRGGQRMLGSVANHAWSDDSLYVTHGKEGKLRIERESKHAVTAPFEIRLEPLRWAPVVTVDKLEDDVLPSSNGHRKKRMSATRRKVLEALGDHPSGITATAIAEVCGRPFGTVYQHLMRLYSQGLATRDNDKRWKLTSV